MTVDINEFHKFFNPNSIAIVGVSIGTYRFGGTSFLNKLQESGFAGRLYPLNPKAETINDLKAYPNLSSLPETPDLAIVCVAAKRIPDVLKECTEVGTKHIHILTSGFQETGTKEGRALEEQVIAISKENGLLVIGPNCMGPYCPSSHLTAWGAIPGLSGPVGVISQSGGITQRLTENLCSLGIGVDKAVSIGNEAVLTSRDFLAYMAEDNKIKVIAMYLESAMNGSAFLDLAREVNRKKPIVLLKGGLTSVGASTVSSHTGSMAGERKLWEAFFRQTGVIQAHSIEEWVDTITAFCTLPAPTGKGVFLIGGGGGNSVVFSDICIQEGLDVPKLSDSTMEVLRKTVPEAGSIAGNPLDMFQVFQDAAYLGELLELAYRDPAVSMIIVDRLIPRIAFHLPDLPDSTPAVIDFVKAVPNKKPTVFTVDSDGGDETLAAEGALKRSQFSKAGIPAYPTFERAAKVLVHLYRYHTQRQ
ncbi:MAG: CoA-binding protein [Deltaproteobacteria bacterium]|nr:CoA-binding protein [Deltaproteobacteria bacterium]